MIVARALVLLLAVSTALGGDKESLRGKKKHEESKTEGQGSRALQFKNFGVDELQTDADLNFGDTATFSVDATTSHTVKWENLPKGDAATCRLECNSSPYGASVVDDEIFFLGIVSSDLSNPASYSEFLESDTSSCNTEFKIENTRDSAEFYTFVAASAGLTNARLKCVAPGCNNGSCLTRLYNGVTNFIGRFRGSD